MLRNLFVSLCGEKVALPSGGQKAVAVTRTMMTARVKWGWVIAILAVLALTMPAPAVAIPCTTDDYIGSYTACVGGLRNLIYYLNPASTCTGGVSAPANQFNIPCGT